MATTSGTRQHAVWAHVACVLVVLPTVAAAQEPAKSFDQLNTRVTVGDTVIVTDAQGRVVTGKSHVLKDASISIVGIGTTTLPADQVGLVEWRSKSVGKAALCGAAVGAAVGAVLGLSHCGSRCSSTAMRLQSCG
jgi:hypothetical protein